MLRETGIVIALDRSSYKIDRIRRNIKLCQVQDKVRVYVKDSTNLEGNSKPREFQGLPGQGFAPQVFDRIMLDPPCTGFGQRPVFAMTKVDHEVNSFRNTQPGYQKRLISQAVRLLKVGGTMVYSTCTVREMQFLYCDKLALTIWRKHS
jgi:16S rRNA C967 or C1407 C5-methylase (RsmB/RsmF family)